MGIDVSFNDFEAGMFKVGKEHGCKIKHTKSMGCKGMLSLIFLDRFSVFVCIFVRNIVRNVFKCMGSGHEHSMSLTKKNHKKFIAISGGVEEVPCSVIILSIIPSLLNF